MNYIITDTSEYALSLLRSHTTGTVHSVYRKTVNLLLRPAAAGNPRPESFRPELSGAMPAQSEAMPEQSGTMSAQSGTMPAQSGTRPEQSEARSEQSAPPEDTLSSPREVLVALQAAGSPLSPISLITELSGEQMASLPIQAGMQVRVYPDEGSCQPEKSRVYPDERSCRPEKSRVRPDEESGRPDGEPLSEGKERTRALSVGPFCTFHIRAEHPADLCLRHRLPGDELDLLERRITEALAMRDAGSFELLFTAPEKASGILFLPVAQKRLDEARDALARQSYSEAAGSLARLIGLGPGLTPAGDDFLCGVLAGLTLCGQDAHPFALTLRREISGRLSDTNKISAAFLVCALENQFSQAVNELRLRYPATKILHIFREIGHSSGTDSLCGVLFLLLFRRLL